MAAARHPSTPAVLALRAAGVAFTPHLYAYEEHGGTAVSSRELGVDEHCVVKTLVMADDQERPLIVLMHGDRKVSTKALARALGAKRVEPCRPDIAQSIPAIRSAAPRRSARASACRSTSSAASSTCRAFTSMAAAAVFWSRSSPR